MCLLNEKENREKKYCFTRVFSFFFFFYPDCEDSIKDFVEGIPIDCVVVFVGFTIKLMFFFGFSVFFVAHFACLCSDRRCRRNACIDAILPVGCFCLDVGAVRYNIGRRLFANG